MKLQVGNIVRINGKKRLARILECKKYDFLASAFGAGDTMYRIRYLDGSRTLGYWGDKVERVNPREYMKEKKK